MAPNILAPLAPVTNGKLEVFPFNVCCAKNANAAASTLSTDDLGMPVDYVEAAAFAFFARQTLEGNTSSLPSVTGAKSPKILGAFYAA